MEADKQREMKYQALEAISILVGGEKDGWYESYMENKGKPRADGRRIIA